MIEHADVLENKAANKITDNAHKLFLSLIEHQRIEIMT